jgi:nucleoid DNA-binding protein
MNKYLIEILKLRTSVTLPGFGALMIANSKTGKIVLNQLLKYDDKILAKFIAEKENIDVQEAQNMVSKFIKEIDLDISKGETYDIFQFGKISKTENGSILFEMDDAMRKEIISPVVSVPKVEKKKVVKKEVVKPIEKEKEIPKNVYTLPAEPKVEKLDEIKTVEVKVVKVETEKPVIKTTSKATQTVEDKEVTIKSGANILDGKVEPKQDKKAIPIIKDLDQDDKKKKRKVWPWVFLLLLIGLGIITFIFQDKLKAELGLSTEAVEVDIVSSEQEINNNEQVVEEVSVDIDTLNYEDTTEIELADESEFIEEENVIEEEPEQTSILGSYHIIGGAFGEASNATLFAEKIGGTVIGRFSGMYQVSIKSYETRAEVNLAFPDMKLEYSGAWIFKYPK